MNRITAAVAAALVALTVAGFLFFPGHTYLHSDTQVYIPILERLWDGSVFGKDMVAQRPHVSYSIYDETALLLRRITGADGFRGPLYAQQLLFRALGLLGVYLTGRSLCFSIRLALLLASVYGLGGTIGGPSVLIHEYEPIPRGYAGGLVVFAVGLISSGRMVWGAAALGLAILYHPPTTYPAVLVLFAWAAWKRDFRWLWPVAAAVAAALVLSKLQSGETEPQQFFGTIDAELAKLQQLRGRYNWLSLWDATWIRHIQMMALVCAAALWRLCPPQPLRWIWAGLPLVGLLSMPAAYLLLDIGMWQFMPQFQPLRAVLFVTLTAGLACAACGIRAGMKGRMLESAVWFYIAFAIPAQSDVLQLLLPDWRVADIRMRALVTASLAALAALASAWESSRRTPAIACWVAVLALPFYLIPGPGKVRNYRDQDQPESRELAAWARANTPKDAVFQFPDAGQELYPGFFRAYSLRSLYVDYKGGGQVNLLRRFAMEWWDRWQKAAAKGKDPAYFGALGIDYLVYKAASVPKDAPTVWRSVSYAVLATKGYPPGGGNSSK